jgi:hypothetical protein
MEVLSTSLREAGGIRILLIFLQASANGLVYGYVFSSSREGAGTMKTQDLMEIPRGVEREK